MTKPIKIPDSLIETFKDETLSLEDKVIAEKFHDDIKKRLVVIAAVYDEFLQLTVIKEILELKLPALRGADHA